MGWVRTIDPYDIKLLEYNHVGNDVESIYNIYL